MNAVIKELYNVKKYSEFRIRPAVRKTFKPNKQTPKVMLEILALSSIGDLTILGIGGDRANRKIVIAQCKCGKYVARPPMVIKKSEGQGCTKCRPLV